MGRYDIIIRVPALHRGWRPWCAIRFCQVPSHCTVSYSFSSSRSRCQSSSFFFVLCLFFHPPYPPTLIFVGNDAMISHFCFLVIKTSSVFFRPIIFNTSAVLFISFQDILMILRYDHISKASILASICFYRVHVSQAYVNSDHT